MPEKKAKLELAHDLVEAVAEGLGSIRSNCQSTELLDEINARLKPLHAKAENAERIMRSMWCEADDVLLAMGCLEKFLR
jgi:hypothetical protein